MATKNETGFSHEDGDQNDLTHAHSNYGTSPVSSENVPQEGAAVKERFSYDEEITGLSLPGLDDVEIAAAGDVDSVDTDAGIQLLRLIDRVERGDFLPNEKVSFGTVAADIADRIQKVTGIDVTGYSVVIEARQIEHIVKDHGRNGKADHTMANPKDIVKM